MLELRAGLVLTHEVATAQRLFNYKEKLAPEVRGYLKGLPGAEQPMSLAGMHRAVCKWAEIQREGQASGKRTKWGEHIDNLLKRRRKRKKLPRARAAPDRVRANNRSWLQRWRRCLKTYRPS